MTTAEAQAIAHEWVAAFNRHDLEAILSPPSRPAVTATPASC
jgi:hypothetical protein